MTEDRPVVTVLIATRDRPEMLHACVRSVLDNDHESFEVVVVDQSEPPSTDFDDTRVRVLPTDRAGKSRALNLGLRAARGGVVLFTDDDCTVPTTWINDAVATLASDPTIGLLFGPLLPIAHDPTTEVVPSFVPAMRQRATGPREHRNIDGRAGGNIAASIATLRDIGPWDECIGPGAEYPGLEEFDYAYRSLCRGHDVVVDPLNGVHHWGVRAKDAGVAARLMDAYSLGEGAVLAKHIRCGDRNLVGPTARTAARRYLHSAKALVTTGRADGLSQAWWFTAGVVRGLRQPLDRERRLYGERRGRPAWRSQS